MNQRSLTQALRAAAFFACFATTATHADLQTDDHDEWLSAVPTFESITFADLEIFEHVREQYAHLGAHFIDPDQNIVVEVDWLYLQDGIGLSGGDIIEIAFDEPQHAWGAHFPGQIRGWFYRGDEVVFETGLVGIGGGSGFDWFHGVVLDEPFDRVRLLGRPPNPFGDPDTIVLDNIYFSTVPAPGAMGVLAGIAIVRRRRR